MRKRKRKILETNKMLKNDILPVNLRLFISNRDPVMNFS